MQVALLGNWKNNQQMTNFIAQKLLADNENSKPTNLIKNASISLE
jgi:hypothetical protein